MGAFFLNKKNSRLLLDDAGKIFNRKGFTVPKTFDLGYWELSLYRKQVVDEDNFLIAENGISIFCCGTVAYRGNSYRQTLRQLVDVFR